MQFTESVILTTCITGEENEVYRASVWVTRGLTQVNLTIALMLFCFGATTPVGVQGSILAGLRGPKMVPGTQDQGCLHTRQTPYLLYLAEGTCIPDPALMFNYPTTTPLSLGPTTQEFSRQDHPPFYPKSYQQFWLTSWSTDRITEPFWGVSIKCELGHSARLSLSFCLAQ